MYWRSSFGWLCALLFCVILLMIIKMTTKTTEVTAQILFLRFLLCLYQKFVKIMTMLREFSTKEICPRKLKKKSPKIPHALFLWSFPSCFVTTGWERKHDSEVPARGRARGRLNSRLKDYIRTATCPQIRPNVRSNAIRLILKKSFV